MEAGQVGSGKERGNGCSTDSFSCMWYKKESSYLLCIDNLNRREREKEKERENRREGERENLNECKM